MGRKQKTRKGRKEAGKETTNKKKEERKREVEVDWPLMGPVDNAACVYHDLRSCFWVSDHELQGALKGYERPNYTKGVSHCEPLPHSC